MFLFNRDKSGTAVKKLQDVADRCSEFRTSIQITFDSTKPVPINAARSSTLIIESSPKRREKLRSLIELTTDDGYLYQGVLRDGFRDFAELCCAGRSFDERGEIDFYSVKVESSGSRESVEDLKDIAKNAWYEAFGVSVPTAEELEARKAEQANKLVSDRERFVQMLSSGHSGVMEWNAADRAQKSACDFSNLKFVGARLEDAFFHDVVFKKCYFDNANLSGAQFEKADLRSSRFRGANMTKVSLSNQSQFTGCDFTDANLTNAAIVGKLDDCIFDNAVLHNATLLGTGFDKASYNGTDFSGVEIFDSDLRSIDLSRAKNLASAKFNSCFYRTNSKWPSDFKNNDPEHLKFRGKGSDPLLLAALMSGSTSDNMDFDTFLIQLDKTGNAERIKKSLAMLRADRFQLFSEIADDAVVGIVRSQSSEDLVYSCMLDSTGAYFCCTQNLRACGGLRGAVCKHILVLIIGLAKANQLGAGKTYQWILKSRAQDPHLQKERASEIFLRYKGVEAGEVDWRPTETMPEDYYAY